MTMAATTSRSNATTTALTVATTAGAAVLLSIAVAAAVFYLKPNNNNNPNNSATTTTSKSAVDPKIVQLFEKAVQDSQNLTNTTNTEKLILYSLYKQSREGDAPTPQQQQSKNKWSLNLVAKAKLSAWERLRGMSTTQAMIHYIEGVQQLSRHGSIDTSNDDENDDDDDDDLPLEGGLGNKPSTLIDYDSEQEQEQQGPAEGGLLGGKTTNINSVMTKIEQKLLRAASENNKPELEQILKSKPELVHHRDKDGQSACHLAADKGAIDALKLLLDLGADGSAADDDGITVLHAAVISDNIEACKLLLAHPGVDPDQPDVDGDTPRKCAEEDGSDAMKALFDDYPPTTTATTSK